MQIPSPLEAIQPFERAHLGYHLQHTDARALLHSHEALSHYRSFDNPPDTTILLANTCMVELMGGKSHILYFGPGHTVEDNIAKRIIIHPILAEDKGWMRDQAIPSHKNPNFAASRYEYTPSVEAVDVVRRYIDPARIDNLNFREVDYGFGIPNAVDAVRRQIEPAHIDKPNLQEVVYRFGILRFPTDPKVLKKLHPDERKLWARVATDGNYFKENASGAKRADLEKLDGIMNQLLRQHRPLPTLHIPLEGNPNSDYMAWVCKLGIYGKFTHLYAGTLARDAHGALAFGPAEKAH